MKKKNLIILVVAFVMLFSINVNAQFTSVKYGSNSPVVSLTSDDINDSICHNSTVVFSTPAESSTTYEYLLDGSTEQGPAVSSAYINNDMSVGGHQIIVIADNGSCSTTDTISLFEVLLDMNPAITNDNSNEICVGEQTIYRATGVGAINYDWHTIVAGVDNSIQNSGVDTFAVSGLNDGDQVYAVISNGECDETSNTLTMVVHSLPVATLVNDDNGEICSGAQTISRTTVGMSNYDYQINAFSVQNTAVDSFLTTVFVDGDVLTVVVTDTNGCSAVSNPITMTVHSLPTITDITYSSAYSSSTSECVGTVVDATITMTGTSPFTVEVYDLVGGNPTNLLFTQSGLTGPTDTYQEPVFGVGAVEEYTVIRDAYCPSVLP